MSTLNVDALVGNTSANAITVRGEGSATTSLQQGLAKGWINMNGVGTLSSRDSLNFSSFTDNAAANHTVNFSNNMGNNNYATLQGVNDDPGAFGTLMFVEQSNGSNYGAYITTSSFKFRTGQNTSQAYVEVGTISMSMLGDLA